MPRSRPCAPRSARATTRDLLDDLLDVLADGAALEGRHADELDRLLTLALQSGRVRALYGPGGEQAALRAFRKLPTGSELPETHEARSTRRSRAPRAARSSGCR